MTNATDFLDILSELEKTPESVGLGLRLDLSQIIHQHLADKKISQKKFATMCGMKPPLLARVMYSNANCTFDTAGRILYAMGVRGKLRVDRGAAISGSGKQEVVALHTAPIKEANGKEEISSNFKRIDVSTGNSNYVLKNWGESPQSSKEFVPRNTSEGQRPVRISRVG